MASKLIGTFESPAGERPHFEVSYDTRRRWVTTTGQGLTFSQPADSYINVCQHAPTLTRDIQDILVGAGIIDARPICAH